MQEKEGRSAIRDQENPKRTKVKARVERRPGWDHTVQGARLGAFSTRHPLDETL